MTPNGESDTVAIDSKSCRVSQKSELLLTRGRESVTHPSKQNELIFPHCSVEPAAARPLPSRRERNESPLDLVAIVMSIDIEDPELRSRRAESEEDEEVTDERDMRTSECGETEGVDDIVLRCGGSRRVKRDESSAADKRKINAARIRQGGARRTLNKLKRRERSNRWYRGRRENRQAFLSKRQTTLPS